MFKTSYVIINDGEYKEFKFNRNITHTIYTAVPLVTCFAILFRWNDNAILYHASSGIPEPAILRKFSDNISKDELKDVEIIIALSDTKKIARLTLEQCVKNLRNAGFINEPVIKENMNSYSIDNYGNHEEILSKESINVNLPSPKIKK